MKLQLSRIAELIRGSGEFDENAIAMAYSIDSRTMHAGELFFAIRGERLDGHDFVEAALRAGAVGAVIANDEAARFPVKSRLIAVEDTTRALQQLGAAVRRIWGKKLIGITGSAGKTTTKECVAHVLASQLRVHKSVGNLNNHFGMPLQLLKLEPEHDIAVIEMGMSHAGEIRALAELAKPDVAIVTNVGPVHLENFDSIQGIARAKYELVEALPSGGMAVLNADDQYVCQFSRDFRGKVVTFGIDRPADVRAENIELQGESGTTFDVVGQGFRERAHLPLVGKHNVLNACAAVAVAIELGILPSKAIASLATIAPSDKRGEVLHLAGATIINDCYNSNPKALKSMVEALVSIEAKRRIVVAGEMLELGPTSPDLHFECGSYMAERGIDRVLGVRGNGLSIAEGARQGGVDAEFVNSPEEAGEWLARELKKDDAVLVKASRGVRLEKALEILKSKFAEGK
jgi:UDP-N-acetylmuramoyl-tripeptide--D-alanyl-D-alanine ligase